MSQLLRQLQSLQALSSKLPLNAALSFLYVAQHGPCFKRDLELALGFSTATGSRNTDYLFRLNRLRKPGLDLIKKYEDPNDRRQCILELTDKGQALIEKLMAA